MTPLVVRTRAELAAARAGLQAPVVLVPTMGALTDGHRVLFRHGREIPGRSAKLIVSIFVNPLQFGEGEDFDRYPRPLQQDLAVCAEEGAAVVFAPGMDQMYPEWPVVTVDPGTMGQVLEGNSRPGFFRGVLTVVLKLFQLVRPDVAVFGEKDAQQLALVRRMCADLSLGVQVAAVPIVREPDGLAASSRNGYLSGPERATALALPRALQAGAAAAAQGAAGVLAAAREVLDQAGRADPPLVLDYLALVDDATFAAADDGYRGPARLLVAARSGGTRLIDNTALVIGGPR
jgi:pantoate--beta-alanine ligase